MRRNELAWATSISFVMLTAVPVVSVAEEQAVIPSETAATRDTDRFVLVGGFGFPDALHWELDASLNRYLAVTGRVAALPTAHAGIATATAGVLGMLPLSSDESIVPRHALGLSLEASAFVYFQDYNYYDPDSEEPPRREVTRGLTPLVSIGYLHTSDRNFHIRAFVGFLSRYFQESLAFEPTFRLSFGVLF